MMNAPSMPDVLRDIANRGLFLVPSPMLRYQSGARHATRQGIALTAWGLPGASFNKAAALARSPSLTQITKLANNFFGDGPNAYGVLVEADADHPVEAELRAAGWRILEDEPALVLPVLPTAFAIPPELEIRQAQDAAARRDTIAVVAAGFGAPTAISESALPEGSLDDFAPSLDCMRDPDVAVLVGYCEGTPVSASIMHRIEEIASITGVATVPAFRRRGFARALTWAAVLAGAKRGCTCATLAALGASFDLYRSMGFIHVCNHRLYVRHSENSVPPAQQDRQVEAGSRNG